MQSEQHGIELHSDRVCVTGAQGHAAVGEPVHALCPQVVVVLPVGEPGADDQQPQQRRRSRLIGLHPLPGADRSAAVALL